MIEDGDTIVTSPHRVDGPDSNDLALTRRKRGGRPGALAVSRPICAPTALCALIAQGFDVVGIHDAVGAPGDATMLNAGMIAKAVWPPTRPPLS